MNQVEDKGWNPYLAGVLSGVLIIFSVLITGSYFGASTTFVRAAGLIEGFFFPAEAAKPDYFIKYPPEVDWQWMFVAGILMGAFLSAITSGSFKSKAVPDMWASRFGGGRLTRALAAFIGGAIAMFGARTADG